MTLLKERDGQKIRAQQTYIAEAIQHKHNIRKKDDVKVSGQQTSKDNAIVLNTKIHVSLLCELIKIPVNGY
jgi:phage gp45-like